MDGAAFATARGARLARADEELEGLVRESLSAYPGDDWDEPIVTGAQVLWLEMFSSESPRSYPDATLRRFREELAESIAKTSEPSNPPDPAQVARVTRWVATYTVNHATYHASRANGHRQKRWITRHDDAVRETHRTADGQTVNIGTRFDIGGSKLRFPGDPVGDPANWIECRCVLQAVGRGIGMTSMTAAATDEESFEDRTGVVIVALPAAGDPITAASSEDIPHMTLLWLGDLSELDGKNTPLDSLKANLEQWASQIGGPITEGVMGHASPFGAELAEVALLDVASMAEIRDGMINEFADIPEGREPEVGEDEQFPIASAYSQTEQFPTWIPHVTLGYPETPALGEYAGTEITFDRLALWAGDDRTEFPMGQTITAAAETAPVEEEVVETPEVEEEVVDDEADIDEELPIPFHGVAFTVGEVSGDGRVFTGPDWRELPIPMMYQEATSGDPHGGAVRTGIIDKIWVDDEERVQYRGWFDRSEAAARHIDGIVFGNARSVSVDLGGMTLDEGRAEAEGLWVYATRSEIGAITGVPVGAFASAYIALGEADCGCDEEDHDEVVEDEREEVEQLVADAALAAPGTKDGPGWITDPIPTGRIRRYWTHGKGALKIKWGLPGDFNRCRAQLAKYIQNPDWLAGACANMHKEATGFWPGREGGDKHGEVSPDAPAFALMAAATASTPPREWFANPNLTAPTPLQVTEDGRVFGHLATWGTCHIGIAGVCTTPPSSASNYAYFHTGLLATDAGDVQVGQLSMGIGHAGPNVSAAAATAHYDKTEALFADVVMGEDGIGIWFSGALRANIDDSKRAELRATGKMSGDWRRIAGSLELIAAVSVGAPGFPIPRLQLAASAGHQDSLIASGIVGEDQGDDVVLASGTRIKPSDVKQMVGMVASELEARKAREAKLARVSEQRAAMRAERIEQAKRLVEAGK